MPTCPLLEMTDLTFNRLLPRFPPSSCEKVSRRYPFKRVSTKNNNENKRLEKTYTVLTLTFTSTTTRHTEVERLFIGRSKVRKYLIFENFKLNFLTSRVPNFVTPKLVMPLDPLIISLTTNCIQRFIIPNFVT